MAKLTSVGVKLPSQTYIFMVKSTVEKSKQVINIILHHKMNIDLSVSQVRAGTVLNILSTNYN